MDHHAAGDLTDKIMDKISAYLPRDFILDMRGVTFMDSSGIAIVLRTYRKMNGIGGRLRVENVGKQPMHVFDAAGIDRIINLEAAV